MDNEYLIKKWLSDEALSTVESKAFNAMEDAALYNEIIEEAQRFSGDENAKVLPFNEFEKQLTLKNNATKTNWIKLLSGIAAILVVGFAVFTLLFNNNINTYKTDYAQNEIIKLPDNSIVNLNQLSQLSYDASNWDNNRAIELNGEAFFSVEKGKRFDVKTSKGTVSVLGTKFNVSLKDSIFKVVCYEGLVQVSYDNEAVKLPAGTAFTLKSGHAIKNNIAIAEPYWIKNMSVFKNAALKDVFSELENRYNVKIDYKSDTITYFTGAFEHNNLNNALKSITNPLNLTFIILNDKEVKIEKNAKN